MASAPLRRCAGMGLLRVTDQNMAYTFMYVFEVGKCKAAEFRPSEA